MHFGTYSALLLAGLANGLALSVVLAASRENRTANRLLAVLIALVALRFAPYVLGFAGAFDRYRWLTFAPFDFSLAFGPLLWAYVLALTRGAVPKTWSWHLLPAGLQLGYFLVCFGLPVDAKWDWYTGAHQRIVEPIGFAGAVISLAAYVIVTFRDYRRYQFWLLQNLSNRDAYRLHWLRNLLFAFGATAALAGLLALTSWLIRPLDYFDRLPGVIWLAGLAYFLGLGGWRYGSVPYPVATIEAPADSPDPIPSPQPAAAAATSRIYAEMATRWRSRLMAEGWWRDEALTLADLAQRLHTSPRTLSRALGEGLGQSFNEFINRIRVEAVAAELADPARSRDLLDIAFDAGFSSKASFNRAFKQYRGLTPSAFRSAARTAGPEIRQVDVAADFAAPGDRV